MDEAATSGVATTLLDKILTEVLSFSHRASSEDLILLDNFLVGVLINVLIKSPRLDHSYHLVVFRILLNAPTSVDSDCGQRAKVVEEILRSRGMNYILSVFQGLYNEVKYNMSVDWSHQMIEKTHASSSLEQNFINMMDMITFLCERMKDIIRIDGNARVIRRQLQLLHWLRVGKV